MIPKYQELHKNFDKWVKVRGLKTGKGSMYQDCVRDFLLWLELNGVSSITRAGRKEIFDYYEYLIKRPKKRGTGTIADSTIRMHLYSLRLFYQNLYDTKKIKAVPHIPRHKSNEKEERQSLTQDEIKIVYEACIDPMERALLSVAYGCGLRRAEIENLKGIDVLFRDSILIVRKGKGTKRREIPLADNVKEDLWKYYHEHRRKLFKKDQTHDFFFVNHIGLPMSGATANNRLKKILKRTECDRIIDKNISLHCLRHSLAQHLVENGASTDLIQIMHGHLYADTSQIYIKKKRILQSQKQKILNIL